MPGAVCAQSLDHGRVDKLYAAAKQEGRVIIWGTQRREVEWIPAAFAKAFPGIAVQFLGDNDIAVKAIAEARAGRHQVDVYQNSLTGTLPLVQRDLLANIDWSLFGIDNRNIAFDGKMAYTSNIVYTVAYNNKLAKDTDAPKNWIDILDERYKGKGASSTFLLPRLIGALGLAWGDDKALQFARDIVAKTNLLLTRAPRESLLQSGERVYAFGEIDSLIRAVAAEGLPVSQVVPQPVVVGQFGATIMRVMSFHLMPYADLDLSVKDSYRTVWVVLPNSYYDPKKGHALYNRYLDELELCAELGFDGVCVNEHHQNAYGLMPSPVVMASALARRTRDCRIAILGNAFCLREHPLTLAEEHAMLDVITGGRLISGFVRGVGSEYFSFGTNPVHSLERHQEAHDLVVRA